MPSRCAVQTVGPKYVGDVDVGVSLSFAGLPLRETMRLAARAEAAGFGVVNIGEMVHDSFAAASAVATATTSIAIMTGVTTWQRPPVTTATGATTVDEVSNGRFTLGLGTMPEAWSRDYYGIDPSRPIGRMEAYLEAVRAAMKAHSGATCDVDNEFFSISGYRRAIAPLRDDIPVVLAVTRPAMARLAGRVADGVYFNVIHTTDWIANTLTPEVRCGRSASLLSARSFHRYVMVRAAVDHDAERAHARLANSLRMYLGVPYLYEVASRNGFDMTDVQAHALAGRHDDAVAAIPHELVPAMSVYGPADACASQLLRYRDLVDTVILAPPSGLAPADGLAAVEAIIDTPWKQLFDAAV
jgi:5,10-methylenetetrahydromethanopterin reductase